MKTYSAFLILAIKYYYCNLLYEPQVCDIPPFCLVTTFLIKYSVPVFFNLFWAPKAVAAKINTLTQVIMFPVLSGARGLPNRYRVLLCEETKTLFFLLLCVWG